MEDEMNGDIANVVSESRNRLMRADINFECSEVLTIPVIHVTAVNGYDLDIIVLDRIKICLSQPRSSARDEDGLHEMGMKWQRSGRKRMCKRLKSEKWVHNHPNSTPSSYAFTSPSSHSTQLSLL
jgi:hypothetical protein